MLISVNGPVGVTILLRSHQRIKNMSAWMKCEFCGRDKEVPAYPGDGVFHTHICPNEPEEVVIDAYKIHQDDDSED